MTPEPEDLRGFAWALLRLVDGAAVTRVEWGNQWVKLQEPDSKSKMKNRYLYKRLPNATLVPWVPDQLDLLADDWYDLSPEVS